MKLERIAKRLGSGDIELIKSSCRDIVHKLPTIKSRLLGQCRGMLACFYKNPDPYLRGYIDAMGDVLASYHSEILHMDSQKQIPVFYYRIFENSEMEKHH